MPPAIASHITQHTLWQALTGGLPPLALPPTPIPTATLDSRDIDGDGLFVAFPGQETDGHRYCWQAIAHTAPKLSFARNGDSSRRRKAGPSSWIAAQQAPTPMQTPDTWREAITNSLADSQLAYVVDNTTTALQALGGFQRAHHANPDLRVVGITGSVGKTSTKELDGISPLAALAHAPQQGQPQQRTRPAAHPAGGGPVLRIRRAGNGNV